MLGVVFDVALMIKMPFLSVSQKDEVRLVEKERELRTIDVNHDDYYFPSVDLLTAQVTLGAESHWKHVLCAAQTSTDSRREKTDSQFICVF